MGTLTGNKIKDTYDGLLKTTDSTSGIPATGVVVIQDGLGNDSALKIGRAGNGVESDSDLAVTGELSVNGEMQVDQDANFDTNVTFGDTIEVSQDIECGNDLNVGNDLSVTGGASVQGNVQVSTGIDVLGGNIHVTGGSARVGIRTNSPAHALDVIGSAEVSGRVKFSGGKIETLGFNNANKFGEYGKDDNAGSGNLPSMAIKTGNSPFNWLPKYSLAVASSGFVVEDEKYYTIKIQPSAWEANQGGQGYRVLDLFDFPIGAAMIPFITEVHYLRAAPAIDTQPNYPPIRGGYGGPNEDPYIYINTGQGEVQQIWSMSLGEYRNNSGAYITNKPLTFNEAGGNYNQTFRNSFMPQLGLRKLNRPGNGVSETRPNYNVYLTIKYRLVTPGFYSSRPDRTL